jgi:hypothetical protein
MLQVEIDTNLAKFHISINGTTSIFDFHMRREALGLPTILKKKYPEIIVISCYNLLRIGRDQSLYQIVKKSTLRSSSS